MGAALGKLGGVSALSEGEKESPPEAEDGRQWIWVSYAPEFRLILTTVVGPCTYESALKLIRATASIEGKDRTDFACRGYSCPNLGASSCPLWKGLFGSCCPGAC